MFFSKHVLITEGRIVEESTWGRCHKTIQTKGVEGSSRLPQFTPRGEGAIIIAGGVERLWVDHTYTYIGSLVHTQGFGHIYVAANRWRLPWLQCLPWVQRLPWAQRLPGATSPMGAAPPMGAAHPEDM